MILVKYILVLPLRSHQNPLVNSIILIMISLFRLCLLVSPSLCEEAIRPLMVSRMSRKIIFCWSPWLLLPHLTVCTSVSSFHSDLSILLLLLLHVVFDGQHLYISTFSLCVTFLYYPIILLLFSNFFCFIPLVLTGKGSVKGITVSLFQHMVVRL